MAIYPGARAMARLYVKEHLSTRQVAVRLGSNSFTVREWLDRAGIARRSISEAKAGQKPSPKAILASVRARRKHVLPGRPEVGYKLNEDGYVLVHAPDSSMADGQGYVKEHRLVLAQKIGRPLLRREDAHHKNRVRHDNDPGNLELKASRADHQREHSRSRKRTTDGRFA